MSHQASHQRNVSAWEAGSPLPSPGPLTSDATADVCIIGAGIAGITSAYLLAREGASVVVLDRGPLLAGETKHTTAHLSCVIDDRFTLVEKLRGVKAARLAAGSHAAAIAKIASIAGEEGIECDFESVDAFLFADAETSVTQIDLEFEAALRAGLEVERVATAPRNTRFDLPGLMFRGQAQFHPLKYLRGLIARCTELGVRFHSNTPVIEVEGGAPASVATASGKVVHCGAALVTTNSPINEQFAIHTKAFPYRTFVVGVLVPKGSIPHALFWDTADPYHYVRCQTWETDADGTEHDLLIIGGEDHKTGHFDDALERYARLDEWARGKFNGMGRTAYQWSGQVLETLDGLAYIGREPTGDRNIYIASGDSGMGMTHGTLAGMIFCDMAKGRTSPWEELYEPSRKIKSAASEYLLENLDVAAQYRKFLTTGDVSSTDEISAGSGAIVRNGMKKEAVYRDDDGNLHRMSAICPHLGCIVSWNSATASWDCPCHGSRFDCTGKVLTGPAISDLQAK